MNFPKNTSWQKVAPWYNKVTRGGEGHYYHEHVIIPGVLRPLELNNKSQITNNKLLDVACGNGVLAKALPKDVEYLGIDISPALIKKAQRTDHNTNHNYLIANVSDSSLSSLIPSSSFTHATLILALQNISDPLAVLQNISNLLVTRGLLVIVLNHPAFRIPRQSSWGIDDARKIQYRRVDKYMSPMEIPVNPVGFRSSPNSLTTLSYHYPIGDYSKMLKEAGFTIDLIEEWTSDKESVGRAGRMENRSRTEIPLFMAIVASKVSPCKAR